MGVLASDPTTVAFRNFGRSLFGLPLWTITPSGSLAVARATSSTTNLRKPLGRRPTVTPDSTIFGTFNEGIQPGSGDAGMYGGIAAVPGEGIPTEGLTPAGYAAIASNTVSQAMALIGTAMTALAVPIGVAVSLGKTALGLAAKAVGISVADAPKAGEGTPAAEALAAQAQAQAEFAAQNPLTAAVLGFFGIKGVAQPSAEELAESAQASRSAAVAASLGISSSGQGFAFSGSETGYVDVNGNPVGRAAPAGPEPDPDPDPGVGPLPDPDPGQPEGFGDMGATLGDAADGGGGGGGTGGGDGAAGDGGGASP